MSGIIGLSEKRKFYLKKKLKDLLSESQKLNPEMVILFGSFVKEKVHKGSDLDLIVIARDVPSGFIDRPDWACKVLDPDFPSDVLVNAPKEIKKALKEGMGIYERSS